MNKKCSVCNNPDNCKWNPELLELGKKFPRHSVTKSGYTCYDKDLHGEDFIPSLSEIGIAWCSGKNVAIELNEHYRNLSSSSILTIPMVIRRIKEEIRLRKKHFNSCPNSPNSPSIESIEYYKAWLKILKKPGFTPFVCPEIVPRKLRSGWNYWTCPKCHSSHIYIGERPQCCPPKKDEFIGKVD